jgi:iron complex outermembrane receptor protein
MGLGYSAATGDRDVWAFYGELYAPVLKTLELTAALRYDDYSDAGSTWNPKIGAKWTPLQQLSVRGTWATGFRAPGLYENGTSASAGFTTASDPVRCPITHATADCAATVVSINTGNPLIKPEKSTSWTAGIIFEPINNLSGTLDYWNIEVKDQISIGSVQATVDNPSNFPTAVIVRNPLDGLPGIPNSGTLLAVQTPYQNANVVETDGIDFNLRYRWDMKEYGRLTPEIQWTHVLNYKQQLGDIMYQYVGTQGNYDVSSGSATPQDRINFILGYDYGPLNVTGTVRYVSDYQAINYEGSYEESGCISPLEEPTCHVSSFTTLDLAASYKGFKNWEIYGSVINVFNRKAPFNSAAAYYNVNYNYNYAASGATGTTFNLGARYTFK